MGQASLGPVVFFKLASDTTSSNIVGCGSIFFNFLGYEVDEDLSCHLTISRTRKLYQAAVLEDVFKRDSDIISLDESPSVFH
jgi:hypothetical protein